MCFCLLFFASFREKKKKQEYRSPFSFLPIDVKSRTAVVGFKCFGDGITIVSMADKNGSLLLASHPQ